MFRFLSLLGQTPAPLRWKRPSKAAPLADYIIWHAAICAGRELENKPGLSGGALIKILAVPEPKQQQWDREWLVFFLLSTLNDAEKTRQGSDKSSGCLNAGFHHCDNYSPPPHRSLQSVMTALQRVHGRCFGIFFVRDATEVWTMCFFNSQNARLFLVNSFLFCQGASGRPAGR